MTNYVFLIWYLSKHSLIKTYVVGTQKNFLTEMILLSTHTIGFGGQIRILEHEKRSLSSALGECMSESLVDGQ